MAIRISPLIPSGSLHPTIQVGCGVMGIPIMEHPAHDGDGDDMGMAIMVPFRSLFKDLIRDNKVINRYLGY